MNDDIREEGEPLTKEDVDGCLASIAWVAVGVMTFVGLLGYALGVW